ncbi:hypothetical protein ACWYD0_001894 [Klebsiella aerogenes]
MTKSTITDERITSVIERLEHFASNLKWTDVRGAQDLLTAADGLRELQERRKAEAAWRKFQGMLNSGDPASSQQPAPVVPDDVSGPLAHAYKELTPTFMRNHIAVFERYGVAPNDSSTVIQALRIALDGIERRAAMLQAEPVTTANKLPFEQWLSQQTGTIDVEYGCVMTEVFFHWLRVAYESGNSPVIGIDPASGPDRTVEVHYLAPPGYVMVPKEPTAEMQSAGASAIRIETTAINKLWTGNAVFRAMLAAAPQEVTTGRKKDRCGACTEGARGGCGTCAFSGIL